MDSVSILQTLANAYLYGWAGAAVFFVLFIIVLRQNTSKTTLVSKLKKENKDMEQQLAESSEKISDLEAKVESLTGEAEERAAEISRLEDRLASAEKELGEKTEKLKNIDNELSSCRKENAEIKTKVSELEKKTSEQETAIREKDNEIASLVEKAESLGTELEEVRENFTIATLYIHMKKLYDEYTQEYTQNILKGINTMKISDLDMATAQAIFEHAMNSFFNAGGQPVHEEEQTANEAEEETDTNG